MLENCFVCLSLHLTREAAENLILQFALAVNVGACGTRVAAHLWKIMEWTNLGSSQFGILVIKASVLVPFLLNPADNLLSNVIVWLAWYISPEMICRDMLRFVCINTK